MMLCSKQIDEYLENQHNRTVCHTCVLKTVNRNMERGGSEIYIDFTRLYRARLRDYRTVQRYENNRTNHLPASPIAQVKNPQRSPLRLRFLTCTLEEAFCVIDPVIIERYTRLGASAGGAQKTYISLQRGFDVHRPSLKNKLYTKLYQRVHRPSSPKNKYENKMKNSWNQGKPRQIC